MKKILIASGDSYTDPDFKSMPHPEMDCSWPMWPEILAKKLGMEYINLGKSGQGQEYIFSSLIDYIISMPEKDYNRIGLVIPAWSRSQRSDCQVDWLEPQWVSMKWSRHGDVYYFVRKTLRYWFNIQVFCENYNLPLKQVQMLNSLRFKDFEVPDFYRHSMPDIRKIHHVFTSSPYFEKIKKENFISWPENEMGAVCDILKQKHTISELDLHPNKLGQEVIADYIYENL